MALNTYLSITTLNVNGPNAPIKDVVWQTVYKNKSIRDAAYKRIMGGERMHIS